MKINPKIRNTLQEISTQAMEHANRPDSDYKYLRRMVKLFKSQLSEEEQIYTLKILMELVHYRNVVVDPDNMLVLSNIKLRTYMFIFFLSTLSMVIAAILFKTNSSLNGLIEIIARFAKLFSL